MASANVVKNIFVERFQNDPVIIRSPGRVNLIGEHTDYNQGFVLPAAIDKAIYFAIAPRGDHRCVLVSSDMNDLFEFELEAIHKSEKGWPNYLMGVVDQLIKAGYGLHGFNCVFGGDIPIGAGLSSSAALEAGLAFALNHIFDFEIEQIDLVKMAQRAENEFVGVNCGIMDQYVNIYGTDDHVLKIDCRSLEVEYVPFNFDNISIVLFDSCVSHSLATSEYNLRRRECAEGVKIIHSKYSSVNSLRDVAFEMLEQTKDRMTEMIFRRCKFVVEENERLLRGCSALSQGDLKTFGQLMYQTHVGLSVEYEVSCPELDFLVSLTTDKPDVYGARMMGGGFGGCTINLISSDAVEHFGTVVADEYRRKFNIDMKMYVTRISAGTDIISAGSYARM